MHGMSIAAPAGTQQQSSVAFDSDSYSSLDSGSNNSSSIDDEEAERVQQAVELIAEMQLTADQLKVRLSAFE